METSSTAPYPIQKQVANIHALFWSDWHIINFGMISGPTQTTSISAAPLLTRNTHLKAKFYAYRPLLGLEQFCPNCSRYKC